MKIILENQQDLDVITKTMDAALKKDGLSVFPAVANINSSCTGFGCQGPEKKDAPAPPKLVKNDADAES